MHSQTAQPVVDRYRTSHSGEPTYSFSDGGEAGVHSGYALQLTRESHHQMSLLFVTPHLGTKLRRGTSIGRNQTLANNTPTGNPEQKTTPRVTVWFEAIGSRLRCEGFRL